MREHRGVIGFWNDTGGYGFIETSASAEDAFFHGENSVETGFSEGDVVEFDMEDTDKGPRAVNLIDILPALKGEDSTRWSLRFRVSSGFKHAFA